MTVRQEVGYDVVRLDLSANARGYVEVYGRSFKIITSSWATFQVGVDDGPLGAGYESMRVGPLREPFSRINFQETTGAAGYLEVAVTSDGAGIGDDRISGTVGATAPVYDDVQASGDVTLTASTTTAIVAADSTRQMLWLRNKDPANSFRLGGLTGDASKEATASKGVTLLAGQAIILKRDEGCQGAFSGYTTATGVVIEVLEVFE